MSGPWKDGAKAVLTLGFDFDAETLWTSRDPGNAQKPGTLSQGVFGAKVGVPLILELMKEQGMHTTFFIPGAVIERYPDLCKRIVAEGHEVGHHGYLHEWVDPSQPEKEAEILYKGLAALKDILGIKPAGYRSPAWETSENTLRLLVENGFKYSSNFMDDIRPYRHKVAGKETNIVELPVAWSLDDAPYFLFSIKPPNRPIWPAYQVLEVWKEELRGLYKRGGVCNLTMHPQFIGRPGRIDMLSEFIDYARTFDDLWITTLGEVADWWSANHPQ